jgi:phenylpyruvate tautomerase
MISLRALVLASMLASVHFTPSAAFRGVPTRPRTPAVLSGRSAPCMPLGEAPRLRMSLEKTPASDPGPIDPLTGMPCAGDPSLILKTSVNLGDKKLALMKACSKAISSGLGKPESYVAVCISDGQSMIWGGEETPCALGCLYSLGSINLANNKKVVAEITALMQEHGVPADRMYINFFDVPRENCGYNGATFGG